MNSSDQIKVPRIGAKEVALIICLAAKAPKVTMTLGLVILSAFSRWDRHVERMVFICFCFKSSLGIKHIAELAIKQLYSESPAIDACSLSILPASPIRGSFILSSSLPGDSPTKAMVTSLMSPSNFTRGLPCKMQSFFKHNFIKSPFPGYL